LWNTVNFVMLRMFRCIACDIWSFGTSPISVLLAASEEAAEATNAEGWITSPLASVIAGLPSTIAGR
jgi:hypothetical protein